MDQKKKNSYFGSMGNLLYEQIFVLRFSALLANDLGISPRRASGFGDNICNQCCQLVYLHTRFHKSGIFFWTVW